MFEIGQTVFVEGGTGNGFAPVAAYRPDKYLMLDVRNVPWRPTPGVPVALRLFHNGNYVTFRGVTLGSLVEVKLLIIASLERTDIQCSRRDPRYFFNLSVPARLGAGAELAPVMVKDVCARGLQFLTTECVDQGSRVAFHFSFGPALGRAVLPGTLVRLQEKSDHYACGVLFDRLTKETENVWGRFLGELARYGDYGLPEPEVEPVTPAGQNLQLSIGIRTLSARIRGYRNREWLITDIPLFQGEPVTATSSNFGEIEADVRFLRDGVASAFKSILFRQYTSPAPVWIWHYPDQVKRAAVRREARIRTALPAGLEWERGSAHGMMIDLSSGGGRIAFVGDGPMRDEPVKVAVNLPDGAVGAGLMGDVRSVTGRGEITYVGFSFRPEKSPSFTAMEGFLRAMREKIPASC